MLNWYRVLFVGALLCSTLHADAQLTEWRTQVQVTNGSGNGTVFDFDGGLNAPSSFQSLETSSGTALALASSSLGADGFIPTLRAFALADPTRAQAVAWAVQGYTNVSSSPLATSLVLSLTAEVAGGNDLEARMYLFQSDGFEFSIDPGTMLFESSSVLWPGFEAFANNPGPTGFDVLLGSINGPVSETRSFDFIVNPGESFYVWARLVATADNPGVVDAFGTMTASFTNTEGLQPAAVDSVDNIPPVADAGGPYFVECRDAADGSTSLQLDGSGSFDDDGDVITFQWSTTQAGASFEDATLVQPTLDVTGVPLDVAFDVTLTVDDGTAVNEDTVTVTVQDTTAPVLDCPADILEIATAPDGNVVEFTPTATDVCDPNVAIATSAPSGSTFAPGTTTEVIVTATDASNNVSQCSFTVRIMSVTEVIESIEQILADLESDNWINSGQANALTTRLSNIERVVANENMGAACGQIGAFINTVQAKIDQGQIDPVSGQAMIDAAMRVLAAIGC